MPSDEVLSRILAWEAAGLIDPETAARLRQAEGAEPSLPPTPADPGRSASIGAVFGPSPTIAEVFGYVGAGFLLAAWHVLASAWRPALVPAPVPLSRVDWLGVAVEWWVPAAVLIAGGLVLRRSGDRGRRATGVAFLVATIHVAGGVMVGAEDWTNYRLEPVVIGAAAFITAAVLRWRHPALLTQATLLGSGAFLAAWTLGWLGPKVFGLRDFEELPSHGAEQLAAAAYWVAAAVAAGALALYEARTARGREEPGDRLDGERRADLTRFMAGSTLVIGVASSLAFGDRSSASAIHPWLGDIALLSVSGVLVALAFRAASAYLYPAALGVVIALTSLNTTYLAEQTGVGVALLVEGAILIGGGITAERLRRDLRRPSSGPPTADRPDADGEQAELIELPSAPISS